MWYVSLVGASHSSVRVTGINPIINLSLAAKILQPNQIAVFRLHDVVHIFFSLDCT